MMAAAAVGAAVIITAAVLLAAFLLIPTFGTPAGNHHAARPGWHFPAIQARAGLVELLAALARFNGLRTAAAPPAGREYGPAAPARRPQLLTTAWLQLAAVIRAIPDPGQLPHLQHGQYGDSTGTFTAIAGGAL